VQETNENKKFEKNIEIPCYFGAPLKNGGKKVVHMESK